MNEAYEHYILLNLYTQHIPDSEELTNYLYESLSNADAVELTLIDVGQYEIVINPGSLVFGEFGNFTNLDDFVYVVEGLIRTYFDSDEVIVELYDYQWEMRSVRQACRQESW